VDAEIFQRVNTEFVGGLAKVSTDEGETVACFVVDHLERDEDCESSCVLFASQSWRKEMGVWTPMVRERVVINGLCLRFASGNPGGICDAGFAHNGPMRVDFLQKESLLRCFVPTDRVIGFEWAAGEMFNEGRVYRSLRLQSTFDESTGIVRIQIVVFGNDTGWNDGWFVRPTLDFSARQRGLVSVRLIELAPISPRGFRISGRVERLVRGVRQEAEDVVGYGSTLQKAFEDMLPPIVRADPNI